MNVNRIHKRTMYKTMSTFKDLLHEKCKKKQLWKQISSAKCTAVN